MRKEWNKALAMEMYGQDRSDAEIAEAVGVEASTVMAWRRRLGLPGLAAKRRKAAAPAPPAETAPAPAFEPEPSATEDSPDPPPVPLTGAPVAVTVEAGPGCYGELRAPSWAQAGEVLRMLGRMLEVTRGHE